MSASDSLKPHSRNVAAHWYRLLPMKKMEWHRSHPFIRFHPTAYEKAGLAVHLCCLSRFRKPFRSSSADRFRLIRSIQPVHG